MADPTRIGKYDVLERIGQGGFATVYRARDPLMRRIVAIKLCSSENEELRRRFLREAEIVATLDHPSIVRAFDFGFDDAGPYLVQEYLDGEDLRAKIHDQSDISYRRRVALLLEMAHAMAYAHAQGVLHRDIKPGNIRVLESGRIKIMDFGIGRLANAETLTRRGTVLGTAGYLAPEQAMGQVADARSDVFAFGALGYELLTYRRPFGGESLPERLREVLNRKPPPISETWHQCPPELERLIFRCLEKSPGARYPDFRAVIAELEPIHEQMDEQAAHSAPAAPVGLALPAARAATSDRPADAITLAVGGVRTTGGHNVLVDGARRGSLAGLVRRAVALPARIWTGARNWTAPRLQRVRWSWIGAGAVVLLVVTLVAIWASRRPAPQPPTAAVAVVASAPPPPPEPISATGSLVVSALPWGRVVGIVGEDGRAVEVPADAATPMALSLPEGSYEVRVAGGDGVEPQSCRVTILESQTQLCSLRLARVVPVEYFKEAGWWR